MTDRNPGPAALVLARALEPAHGPASDPRELNELAEMIEDAIDERVRVAFEKLGEALSHERIDEAMRTRLDGMVRPRTIARWEVLRDRVAVLLYELARREVVDAAVAPGEAAPPPSHLERALAVALSGGGRPVFKVADLGRWATHRAEELLGVDRSPGEATAEILAGASRP